MKSIIVLQVTHSNSNNSIEKSTNLKFDGIIGAIIQPRPKFLPSLISKMQPRYIESLFTCSDIPTMPFNIFPNYVSSYPFLVNSNLNSQFPIPSSSPEQPNGAIFNPIYNPEDLVQSNSTLLNILFEPISNNLSPPIFSCACSKTFVKLCALKAHIKIHLKRNECLRLNSAVDKIEWYNIDGTEISQESSSRTFTCTFCEKTCFL